MIISTIMCVGSKSQVQYNVIEYMIIISITVITIITIITSTYSNNSGSCRCALIGYPAVSACSALSAPLQMYCVKTNRPVLRVLKLTPRQGTPMRVHKRPPEIRQIIWKECN